MDAPAHPSATILRPRVTCSFSISLFSSCLSFSGLISPVVFFLFLFRYNLHLLLLCLVLPLRMCCYFATTFIFYSHAFPSLCCVAVLLQPPSPTPMPCQPFEIVLLCCYNIHLLILCFFILLRMSRCVAAISIYYSDVLSALRECVAVLLQSPSSTLTPCHPFENVLLCCYNLHLLLLYLVIPLRMC